ncbi:MAG: cysteine desulfurase [Proteobacteria bacterium]|nr:cysteine desulfurase [Pseudomonadota bacterium]
MIYFDYNASFPIRQSIKESIHDYLNVFGNPSSVHFFGRMARKMIEESREKIAHILNVPLKTVIFTSGATESNNTILKGFEGPVILSAQEHDSVFLARKDALFYGVTMDGLVDLNHLENILKETPPPFLVSIMSAHNETGVIQPLDDAFELVKKYGGSIHVDAVQSLGRQSITDWARFDYITFSGHKIGALKGAGVMVIKENASFNPFTVGGGQERSFRAGTENVLSITTMGLAFDEAYHEDWQNSLKARDYIQETLLKEHDFVFVVGKNVARLSNTLLISMPYVKSETQVMNFDIHKIAVSAGSACSSGKVKVSKTLKAMNLDLSIAETMLRMSLPPNPLKEDVDMFLDVWKSIFNTCYLTKEDLKT